MYISTGFIILIIYCLWVRDNETTKSREEIKEIKDWVDKQKTEEEREKINTLTHKWQTEDIWEINQEKSFKEAVDKILND